MVTMYDSNIYFMIKSYNINYLAIILTNVVKLYVSVKIKMNSPFANGVLPLNTTFIISNNLCSLLRIYNLLFGNVSYLCDEGGNTITIIDFHSQFRL